MDARFIARSRSINHCCRPRSRFALNAGGDARAPSTKYLELTSPPGVETLNLSGGLFVMTPKRLALIIGLTLGVGLIAGGIGYAQQAAVPEGLLEAQEPATAETSRLFSI